jgi:hypothetical protein
MVEYRGLGDQPRRACRQRWSGPDRKAGGTKAETSLLDSVIKAATTGSSAAQVTDLHNASGGMWAFAEGNEVMFLVILLYLLRPVVFNIVGRVAATMASPKAS